MSSTTKRAHFVRAVLEGVAFQTCEVLEALTEDSDLRLKSLKVGGGMAVNNLFLQIQADLLGIEVSTNPCPPTRLFSYKPHRTHRTHFAPHTPHTPNTRTHYA